MSVEAHVPPTPRREHGLHVVAAPDDDGVGGPAVPVEAVPSLRDRTDELTRLKAVAVAGDDPRATARLRERGKLTVRERLDALLDPGSFVEIDGLRRHRASGFGMERRRPFGDGVVTGWGTVHGRRVFVHAGDPRVFGGSLGEAQAAKVHKVMDLAEAAGVPVIGLNDGAGARIQEGVVGLAGYGGIFCRTVRSSGVIPQISVVLGPCAGGAAYSPALTDFIFMVRGTSQMFITGPDVIRAVTGEEITLDALGGADVHGGVSGVAGFVHDDELACLDDVRRLIDMLPANNQELPPRASSGDPTDRRSDALLDIVPGDPRRPYDVVEVIEEIVDDGEFFEQHRMWARNVVCGYARLDGWVVGVVANQPAVLAGVLDIQAAEKAARFVQTCDAFNIPLITLVDVPGFLPGTQQEHAGIIRRGATLLHAYCAASVPRIQVILRKAYGGAYIVMDSLSIGADLSFAWPINEIAVMGAEGAANIIHRREIEASPQPEATRAARMAEYRDELMNPFYAAERGLVDDVIDPRDTRGVLAGAIGALQSKRSPAVRRKHANPPF